MITFNADEIFEMAEQIERNGSAFYGKAAAQAQDDEARKILATLGQWEQRHEKLFHRMREELPAELRVEATDDPDHQAELYLQAFADGKVFDPKADPSSKLTGRESLNEVLTVAVGLEKDSIVFYLGLREVVPRTQGQSKVDEIIQEEMKHIRILSEHLT